MEIRTKNIELQNNYGLVVVEGNKNNNIGKDWNEIFPLVVEATGIDSNKIVLVAQAADSPRLLSMIQKLEKKKKESNIKLLFAMLDSLVLETGGNIETTDEIVHFVFVYQKSASRVKNNKSKSWATSLKSRIRELSPEPKIEARALEILNKLERPGIETPSLGLCDDGSMTIEWLRENSNQSDREISIYVNADEIDISRERADSDTYDELEFHTPDEIFPTLNKWLDEAFRID